MANRFENLLNQPTILPGVNRFSGIVDNPQTNRFSNLISQPQKQEGIVGKTIKSFGGAIGAVSNVLLAGQRATTGLIEKGLEKVGVLKPKTEGLGIVAGVKEQKSNIELLRRIGQETGKGGVLTGQYTPSTSVFGNFVKELPVTTLGLAGDIFLDPLMVLGSTGKIAKGTEAIGKVIESGATKLAEEIPAVQKIGDMLGRAFLTRFGQREGFKALDISRKIEESLVQEKVGKLVSEVIEKPAAIQQRITQIIKGEVPGVKSIVKPLQPLAPEAIPKGISKEEWIKGQGELVYHGTPRNFEKFDLSFIGERGRTEGRGFYFTDKKDIAESYLNKPGEAVIPGEGRVIEAYLDIKNPMTLKQREITDNQLREIVKEASKLNESLIPSYGDNINDVIKLLKENKTDVDIISELGNVGVPAQELNNIITKITGYDGIIQQMKDGKLLVAFRPDQIKTPSQLSSLYDEAVKGVKGGEVAPISSKLDLTDNELKILSEPIRQELDRVGESISKLNPKLLSEETFKANKGTYFPRLYTDYEFPATDEGLIKNVFGQRAVSIPREPFKGRILTEAESLAKGTRIEEAGYPALKRLTQLNITEQRQKFFKDVAKLATDEPKPGWIQLSEDKALGDLAGKFLPASEYKAIAEIRKIPGVVEQIYNKALMTWKTFKTAYNPSTIARNDLTNFFILNPLGGVGPHRLDIYAKWTNEIITKGPIYQLARKEGLEISTQQAAELTSKASKFYRENKGLVSQFFGKIGDFNNAVKNFYGSQDKFFKGANFLKGITEDGLTPTQAMRRANFYLVDYSEVPEAIAWLRKSPVGIPFISFTYGVSKPLAKTLLERPDKLGAYFKILSGIQQMNPMGETPQERQAELNVTPDWIQQGTTLRLPVKDKYGRGQYVDLQYILPFNILESHSLIPSSPLLTMMSAMLTNRDSFTGKDITMQTDTEEEKVSKWSTYLIRQIVPSLAPFGYSWEKVKALIQNRPDVNGYVRKAIPVLLDVLGGIKITPIDPTIEGQKRAYEKQKQLSELRSNLIRIQTDKTLLPETKTEETGKIQKKIDVLFSE